MFITIINTITDINITIDAVDVVDNDLMLIIIAIFTMAFTIAAPTATNGVRASWRG